MSEQAATVAADDKPPVRSGAAAFIFVSNRVIQALNMTWKKTSGIAVMSPMAVAKRASPIAPACVVADGGDGHALGAAAAVLPQVEDEGIRVGEKGHGRGDRAGERFRVHEPVELEIADVAGQPFDLAKSGVGLLDHQLISGLHLRRRLLPLRRPGRQLLRAAIHPQVLVLGHLLQVRG